MKLFTLFTCLTFVISIELFPSYHNKKSLLERVSSGNYLDPDYPKDIEINEMKRSSYKYTHEFDKTDVNGNSPLHLIAIEKYQSHFGEGLLDLAKYEHYSVKNNNGDTPFMCAVKHDNTTYIKHLHPFSAEDIKDKDGFAPMHYIVLTLNVRALEACYTDKYFKVTDIKDDKFGLTPAEMLEEVERYIKEFVNAKNYQKEMLFKTVPIFQFIVGLNKDRTLELSSVEKMKELFKKK